MRQANTGTFLAALLLAACSPPPPAAPTFGAEDEAAMDAVTSQALAIANDSQDWDAYVQVYYAPDAVVLPANLPALSGHAAIVDFLRAFPPMTDFRSETVERGGAGDVAYVYGRYHMSVETPDGPVTDEGKYVEVWKRQADGGWKVAYDIFNTDLPAT